MDLSKIELKKPFDVIFYCEKCEKFIHCEPKNDEIVINDMLKCTDHPYDVMTFIIRLNGVHSVKICTRIMNGSIITEEVFMSKQYKKKMFKFMKVST
jgi:hypothetical protein